MTVLFVFGLDMGRCRAGTKPDVVIKYAKMIAKEWQDEKGMHSAIKFTLITTSGRTTSFSLATSANLNFRSKAHLSQQSQKKAVRRIRRLKSYVP